MDTRLHSFGIQVRSTGAGSWHKCAFNFSRRQCPLSSLLCNIALEVLYTQNPTWNECPKHEIKGTIISTIVSKRVKYLGINVTKEVQHFCSEAYKTLLQEKDLNPWENTVCLWVRKFDPIKTSALPRLVCKSSRPLEELRLVPLQKSTS